MKLKKYKIICIITFLFFIFIILHTNTYAATMKMSINKTSAYVGETFIVTISGINGKVTISGNSNISLDKAGSQWVDGSLTITGTTKAVGTGTITVTPVDVTTTAAEPEEVTAPASRSITIKEKEATQTPQTTPTNPSNNTTKKPTTSNTKTEDKKSDVTEDFYISKLNLKGIKENGEQVDIILSPEFNKDTYEYDCNISADIQKIELEKDAGKYTNSVIVTGLEELKEGENIVKLQLSAENEQAKIYTIKIIKAPKEEIEAIDEQNEDIENIQEPKTTKMLSMPLYLFIIMQILIIVIEIMIIYFIFRRKIKKGKKFKKI